MATTASPYGLRPVNRVDGMPYAGATQAFLINPAGVNTNIFNGSIVALDTNGYLTLMTSDDGSDDTTNAFPAGTIGVFVGCQYVNAQGQVINSQYYPAGTTGVVTAYVVTDPNVVFQAQLDGSGGQAVLGANTFLAAVQSTSTGNTQTGNSTVALDATVQTAAAAFRIVGFASTPGDAFTDVLVKFNPGQHSYLNATGI
jgi:hypothetical protein